MKILKNLQKKQEFSKFFDGNYSNLTDRALSM